jgi:small-conductance mechanosensitive channel
MLQEAVEAQDQVRFDRAHFKEFGDFSLNFEIVYYVLSADYNIYMDIQQAMNLHIFRRFEEEGIEFAYPTRTLHITQFAGDFAPDGQEEREPSLQPASSNSKE